jgi:predicted Zn-dependent protease
MIPKIGQRFSEKIMRQQETLMTPTRSRAGSRRLRAAALTVLALALVGCADASRLDLGERVPLREPPKHTAEAGPALHEHQRILAAYGGAYHDPRLEALISHTVERLVAASEKPDLRYKVTILNSPSVNAFALPNGQLYVTRGLLALANDTSELASVLAHEMGHVIARHAAIREEQLRQAELVSQVASDVFKDPQVGALALAKNKLALATFSRGQELEADGIGVGISSRAGFDPNGAVHFLTSMARNAELRPASGGVDPRMLDFLASHPATPERIKVAEANAKQYTGATGAPAGEKDKAAYLAALDGMVYGEDPGDGFVRGRRFVHPRLGFTFTAPETFALENTAQAVLGVKDGGGQALRVDVVKVPAEQSLSDYLVSGWIDNVDKESIEQLTVNGFPTATAAAKGDQWAFRLYVLRYGNEVYRFIFAAKHRSAEVDRAFREAVNSFRRLTPSEVEGAKPLHLKVVTMGPRQSAADVAHAMAVPDRPLERFLILNGKSAADPPKPGDQVKIIVE